MEYGKIIRTESYHQNKRTMNDLEYQIPVIVKDKATALSEIMRSLELISERKTKHLTITIEADHAFKLKRMTKQYKVEE